MEVDWKGTAVFALVQIVACLVPVGDVHPQLQAVFVQKEFLRKRLAGQKAFGDFEAFACAGVRVRPFIDGVDVRHVHENVRDDAFPTVHGDGQELADGDVAIAVDDEAGQAVRFAENEPPGICDFGKAKRFTILDGGFNAFADEIAVDFLFHVKRPDACDDLRTGGIGGACDPFARGVMDFDGVAGLRFAVDAFDAAGEDPWMFTEQRAFASAFQNKACEHFSIKN